MGGPDMIELYEDTETFSATPIKNGVYRYAEDPELEVMIFAYAWGDGPVVVLDLANGDVMPDELVAAQTDPNVVKIFQNSNFDRTVIREGLDIVIPVEQIHDTMVQALAHGLPGKLEKLCEAFKLSEEEAKDKRGKELINLFCKPRPKNQKLRRATKATHPKEWQEFLEYAASDIVSMRALKKKMPMWNYAPREHGSNLRQGCERYLWELDQRINDRGFKVDVELAEAAIRAIKKTQETLAERTVELTAGEVERATQRDKLLKYILAEHGIDLPDMKKDTLERRINDPDLPRAVRELLAIRLEASATSTGKYKKLLECVCADGYLRGTLQFDGASRTRRWAGRLFQPQNLMRPVHKQAAIDLGIEALKADCADLIETNVMSLCGSCVRGVIIAEEGKKLVVSDLANIEGRAAAWLAGEEWKLEAFRLYDTFKLDENGEKIPDGKGDYERMGPDLYKVAYARAFNVHPDEAVGQKRQIGKVMELMLQYEGGVGAFLTGAATYRIDLDELAGIAWPLIPDDVKLEAEGYYDWVVKQRRSTFGLDKKVFMTCDALKRLWRRAHPAISSYWPELHKCVTKAINNRGVGVQCRKLRIICKGAWLRIILPSGHSLCYSAPRIEGTQITYMGTSPYSRQWKRIKTYGGKFFENICQSLSRDIMAYNMPLVEAHHYDIFLTVHDELDTEAPDNEEWGDEHLSSLLATNPVWAPDFPLAASGFEAHRYRKD
jgi:DNA polymerase